MQFEVFLLGRFEVRRNGQAVTAWPRASARQLMKLLALAPQHRLPLAQLAESLWPQDYGDRVRQRLHHLVYLLRSALDPQGERPLLLRTSDGVLQLEAGPLWVDALAFERAASQALRAAAGDPDVPESASHALQAALALYGGPLLPDDMADPALNAQRQHLERRHAELLHSHAAALARQGRHAEALLGLQQLLLRQPADERAHRALITLYAQARRRDDAERQYAACRAALVDELGVPPSAETHQAYREAMLAGSGTPGAADASGLPGAPILATAPSLAAADALRLHPPAPLVPLVDRDALVQALADRLADPATRLLTLVGPGGMGKTQLALRLAHELQQRWRHGVAFVSLAEVDAGAGSAGLIDRLRRGLRLAEPAGADALQALADALRERHLLLVCDNCEQIAPHLGLLTELLMHCPLLTVLATSRRRLNLRAEQVVPVPALSATAESGLRLFQQRAAAASPGFQLDADNLEDVRAIVQQLGGLPLAIELVAARIPLLPPAALRRALETGSEVAAGGGPDRPVRHRSMQASLAWSRSLLSPLERAVLDRAARFVAPFELAALGAVCQDLTEPAGGDITPAAQSLAELGLLARSPGPAGAPSRWQRPAADAARSRHAAAEAHGGPATTDDMATRRHLAWFAGLARRLAAQLAIPGAQAAQALAAYDADHENFFAALAQARQLGDHVLLCETVQGLAGYWARSGAWQRADPWVLQATESAATLPLPAQATLGLATSAYWHDCQRFDRTRDTALRVQAIAGTLGDARLQARATVRLASALYHLGEAEAAIAQLRPLCDRPADQGLDGEADAALHRAALNNLAIARLSTGELGAAHMAWQACDAQFHGQTVTARVPYLHNLALVAHYEGRHEAAAQLSAQAEACEQTDAPRPHRLALLRLRRSWMACCQGDARQAAQALGDARQAVAMGQLAAWQPVCAAHDGKLALLAGQAERAQALLQRALDQIRDRGQDQGDPWDTLDGELWLIAARLTLAGRDSAPPAVAQALARLATRFGRNWRLEHARILEAAAAWLLRAGQAGPAGRAWQQAQILRRLQRLPRFAVDQPQARRTLATLNRQLGAGWRERAAQHAPHRLADTPLAWMLPLLD